MLPTRLPTRTMRLRRRVLGRLFPRDHYAHTCTGNDIRIIDAKFLREFPRIPVIPGVYLDAQGNEWTLNDDQSWTDDKGVTKRSTTATLSQLAWMTIDGGAPLERVSGQVGTVRQSLSGLDGLKKDGDRVDRQRRDAGRPVVTDMEMDEMSETEKI